MGISLNDAEQPSPDGLALALIIGSEFVGDAAASLVLGDNIFFGQGLEQTLQQAANCKNGATVFACRVHDPERYGVVEFDAHGSALSIEEKPDNPRSHHAVTGLYFYDNRVLEMAARLKPSARGELEITDINRLYLELGELNVKRLGRGTAWLDAGTHESLLEAGQFIETIETRQGLKIGCPEEIAWHKGYISDKDLADLAEPLAKSNYGKYLLALLDERRGT